MDSRLLQLIDWEAPGFTYQGLDLPDFRANVKISGIAHEFFVHGDEMHCGIHGDPLATALDLWGGDGECNAIIKGWQRLLQDWSCLTDTAAMTAVTHGSGFLRTIGKALLATCEYSLMQKLDIDGIKYNRSHITHRPILLPGDGGDWLLPAHENGCKYVTWAELVRHGVTDMAVPGVVDRYGSLTGGFENLLSIGGVESPAIWQKMRQMQPEVNVLGYVRSKYDSANVLGLIATMNVGVEAVRDFLFLDNCHALHSQNYSNEYDVFDANECLLRIVKYFRNQYSPEEVREGIIQSNASSLAALGKMMPLIQSYQGADIGVAVWKSWLADNFPMPNNYLSDSGLGKLEPMLREGMGFAEGHYGELIDFVIPENWRELQVGITVDGIS